MTRRSPCGERIVDAYLGTIVGVADALVEWRELTGAGAAAIVEAGKAAADEPA
jgi:hypothetical protein